MFEHPVDVRWRDVDALGHVNHAVFLTYLEEGRDAFFTRALGDPIYVVARLEIDLMFNAIADAMPNLSEVAAPQRLRSGWINGIKHWQVDYTGKCPVAGEPANPATAH